MSNAVVDAMLYEWQSSYYNRETYTDAARLAERTRRVELGQFVMQRDAPGGSKQFRAFDNIDDVYAYIIAKQPQERTFYETIFDVHPRQKPYFDIDIIPNLQEDPMDHAELLERLLTEVKRVIGADLDLVDDVSIYSSHATDGGKFSYHVVLTGYYVKGNQEALNFAKVIRDGMLAATDGPTSAAARFITDSIDMVVYKKLQQFRILGCTKLARNRFKKVVTEYTAAGRQRIREKSSDPKVEFLRSLLSFVDSSAKHLQESIYTRPVDPRDIVPGLRPDLPPMTFDQAEALLRERFSNYYYGRDNYAWDNEFSLWLKEGGDIVSHLIDAGHLPLELALNCLKYEQKTSDRGALIALRAPPARGYLCIICDRVHEHENPYLTLHESKYSEAATELCPRVVTIMYHCRRDPTTTIRICSMRGGGESGMASFTCCEEPFDPRRGERFVKPDMQGSTALDV